MSRITPKQITNGSENYVLATTGGTTTWVPLSGISTTDGNGIFDASNDGGTVPTAFDTNLTDAWNINAPSSNSSVNFQNLTSGNAIVNIQSNATANGQAILKLDAQGASRDAYIHFNNGGAALHTIGVDSSDGGKFKIGTTSIATSTSLTIDSSQNVEIGGTAPLARLHVRGAGSTNATNALLVENSSGNDLLKIDDAGNVVFNDNSIDVDFRVESDLNPNHFHLNGGTDTIGLGTAGVTNYKVYVDAVSETRTRGMYISATNMGTSSVELFVNHSSAAGTATGLYAATSSPTSVAKGVSGVVTSTGTQGFGGWFSARHNTSKSVAVYGEIPTSNNNKGSAGTYGAQYVNGSPMDDSIKTGVYAGITQAPTNSTSYAMYSVINDAGNDSDIYGNYIINTVNNAARTGVTSTAL